MFRLGGGKLGDETAKQGHNWDWFLFLANSFGPWALDSHVDFFLIDLLSFYNTQGEGQNVLAPWKSKPIKY